MRDCWKMNKHRSSSKKRRLWCRTLWDNSKSFKPTLTRCSNSRRINSKINKCLSREPLRLSLIRPRSIRRIWKMIKLFQSIKGRVVPRSNRIGWRSQKDSRILQMLMHSWREAQWRSIRTSTLGKCLKAIEHKICRNPLYFQFQKLKLNKQ